MHTIPPFLILLCLAAALGAVDAKPPYLDPAVQPGDLCWASLADGRRFLAQRSDDGNLLTERIIREKQVGGPVTPPRPDSYGMKAFGNPQAAVAMEISFDSARLVEPATDTGTILPDLILKPDAPPSALKIMKDALDMRAKRIPETRKRWNEKRNAALKQYDALARMYPEIQIVIFWAYPSWVDILSSNAQLAAFEFITAGSRGGVGVETQNSLRARELWIDIQARRKEMIAASKGVTDCVLRYIAARDDLRAQGWLVEEAAP